ncbi:MAG: DNA polymerase III subunit beta [Pseudomonadota bacterium]
MRLKISREDLLPGLQAANNVVERRHALPILSNVLLAVEGKQLQITGTDMEVEVISLCEGSETVDGAVAVPARKLFDICRALPNESSVDISLEENRLKLRSGRSRFSLATLPAGEFPTIGDFPTRIEVDIDTGVLKGVLEATQFSMAHQDVRYYLNGLLLDLDGTNLKAVATDGHRLAMSEVTVAEPFSESLQVIVPRKGVLEIGRMMAAGPEKAQLSVGDNHLKVVCGSQTLVTKLVDGRFPDYDRVIPKNCDKLVLADRELVKSGLNRASILSNEKFRGIRIALASGVLKAMAHNPEQEEAQEEMEVDYEGDELEIGFNVSYLLDVLSALNAEQVRLLFADSNSSCLIDEGEEANSRYVVMPMRL